MATPEGAVKYKIKQYLKTVPNCWYYMPVQNGMGVVGIPDIVGVINGRFFAIECKAPGKESNVTANQQNVLEAIAAAGGVSFVASNLETVKSYVAALLVQQAMMQHQVLR